MDMLEYINNKNFIEGKWVDYITNIEVYNPANNKVVGTVPNLSKDIVLSAIESSVTAFAKWSQTSVNHRIKIMRAWYDLIIKHTDELALILTLEQGKVLNDAKAEILYAASFVEWFIHCLNNVHGIIRAGNNSSHKIITEYEPIGVVAAITPWNFPYSMVTRKITPAIATGCTVVLKPSKFTPLSALALAKLAEEAGLPAGVLNVITGEPALIGQAFCDDFRIRKLSFTGSTNIGKILYKNSSSTLKRLSLELGGNAPFIIFDDYDVNKVAEDLINVKVRGSGQSCTSPNRIFVHKNIYNQFADILHSKFSVLKVGDGMDPKSNVGPLINRNAVDRMLLLINDAKTKGANVLCGGTAIGNFLEPTIITDCEDNMEIFRSEIFGPVIALYRFSDDEEVLARANNTEYGLQAYVYSVNQALSSRLASKLDFGMVSINSSAPFNCKANFAGRKISGFGIEGGDYGIFEYLTRILHDSGIQRKFY